MRAIGDYENYLFEKEQRQILKEHQRKKKKEKTEEEEVEVDCPVQEQKKSLGDQTSILGMSHKSFGRKYRCYK